MIMTLEVAEEPIAVQSLFKRMNFNMLQHAAMIL